MGKKIRPLVLFFLIVNALAVVGDKQIAAWGMKQDVLIVANILLFVFSLIGLLLQLNASKNPNPNAIVRAVMAGMGLKLIGFAAALLIYLSIVGKDKSVYSIYAALGLYVVYTWMEVRLFLRQNPKKNARI
ncbi:MAG: hypothetical protein HYI21_12300 [Sediminibacterium sp. Gen4]|uniref:hypothetical protein n=1 Tax=unclassified Sediminibacterium TaxID=2635961 RepID=UPI0015BF43FB|nr:MULTISPECIES: hypothetical protein [unclassified Sediminibacterium]MBW0162578.1 hypothetical protein [Sediminibacterium sp.]MBW0165653.1 hypothetical protein [Sediminibacterium sp.]NWK66802.1 hypothetical protein [Sediminibacterium sp. Gen4]